MSHDDMSNSSGFNEAATAFSWNGPKKAINPYLDPAEVAPESALLNLITLYAADNEQEQLRRDALSEQVWERYFFNESRDPVQREMEQDKLISRAKLAHEQQRFNPDMVILADVSAQPTHISKPLMQGVEVLLTLPEMSQDQVKRLSTLVAAHMSMCLDAACGDLYATDDVKPEEIRKTWEKVAAETLRLDVMRAGGGENGMSSHLRLSNSVGKETAVNPYPMNSFRVRWRVCCAPTGGIGNYGRCVANGGKSSCVLSAWSAKKHLPMSAMKP